METTQAGNRTESAVLAALVMMGFDVLVPFGEGHPYDLVAHASPAFFMRVQCKTARPQGACISFNSRRTDHGQGRRSYEGLADVFGVYAPAVDSTYFVPVEGVSGFAVRLRLRPTLNNQALGVRFARDFISEEWSVERFERVIRAGSEADERAALA